MVKRIEEFTKIIKSSIYDSIYLDEENKIFVYENQGATDDKKYEMIHYRKINGKLVEINRWYLKKYHRGDNSRYIKREHNLLLIQGGQGIGNNRYNCTDAIYNYKEGKFIVEKGTFDCIGTDNSVSGSKNYIPNVDYLNKYGCFLAYFKLYSTKEDDDVILYKNQVTGENIKYVFESSSDMYFALIDIDGKIKGNKLFKGENFSRTYDMVKLDNYTSLEELKKEIIETLNNNKKEEKEKYYEIIKQKNNMSVSPYLDEEIQKVLKLK